MISYELLEKLKNAGFPGIEEWTEHVFDIATTENHEVYTCKLCGVVREVKIGGSFTMQLTNQFFRDCPKAEKKYSEPSLSELIKACDVGEFELVKRHYEGEPEKWLATVIKTYTYFGEGSSPEEAVPNLYLALNKNGPNN